MAGPTPVAVNEAWGTVGGVLQTQGRQSERSMYYRKPMTDVGNEPGYIVIAGTNMDRRYGKIVNGWQPLDLFGFVGVKRTPDSPDGPFDMYGAWGPILCHPEGPKQFTKEQIIELRWYDQKYCPVPGVKFPQLKGEKIEVFGCSECGRSGWHTPLHLARHLRISHSYDIHALIALGKSMGISFEKEFKTAGRETFTFEGEPDLVVDETDDLPEVTVSTPLLPAGAKG
ncbi:MAG: hypothetical protein ACRDGM_18095 [bacterium]